MKVAALAHVVREATSRAINKREYVTLRAMKAHADPNKADRTKAGECVACFYLDTGRLAGQAFTPWQCRACEQEQPHWPNTAVPRLCLECAYKYALCRTCLADDELRLRRRINVVRRTKRAALKGGAE